MAEFVAASQGGQEAIYLQKTLTDFRYSQTKATLLYEDNHACIAMSENPVHRKFSRHIDIRKNYVRELVLAGLVSLRTHKMVADALTKSLPSPVDGHKALARWQGKTCRVQSMKVSHVLLCLLLVPSHLTCPVLQTFRRIAYIICPPPCSLITYCAIEDWTRDCAVS